MSVMVNTYNGLGELLENVNQGWNGQYGDIISTYWQQEVTTLDIREQDYKLHQLPLARIKKVMKADPEVKMTSADPPILFAKGCDIFITELTMRAWIYAEENKRRTLQRGDIASALAKSGMFEFLIDKVPCEEARCRRIPQKSPSCPYGVRQKNTDDTWDHRRRKFPLFEHQRFDVDGCTEAFEESGILLEKVSLVRKCLRASSMLPGLIDCGNVDTVDYFEALEESERYLVRARALQARMNRTSSLLHDILALKAVPFPLLVAEARQDNLSMRALTEMTTTAKCGLHCGIQPFRTGSTNGCGSGRVSLSSLQKTLLSCTTLCLLTCPIVLAQGRLEGFARIAQPISGGVSALSGFSLVALHDDPQVEKTAYYSVYGIWAGFFVTFISLQAYRISSEKRGTYILTCIIVDALLVAVFSLSTLSILEIMTAYAPLLSGATAFVAYQYFPKCPSKIRPAHLASDDAEAGIHLLERSASTSHEPVEGQAPTGDVAAVFNDAGQGLHEAFDPREELQEAGGSQVPRPAAQELES